jgi:hypothetical protein
VGGWVGGWIFFLLTSFFAVSEDRVNSQLTGCVIRRLVDCSRALLSWNKIFESLMKGLEISAFSAPDDSSSLPEHKKLKLQQIFMKG